MSRDIVGEARSLCDEIAGEVSEDGDEARGSIEIVTVLVDEVKRLHEAGKFKVGRFTLFNKIDLYSGEHVIVIESGGEAGYFDPVTLEMAIKNYYNANL